MLKVMLVDDEPFILQGLKVLIDWKKEGFEIVMTAADGQEALGFLAEHQVDLIIADIKMPVMSGIELLGKIRTEHISEAWFVLLSGYADFNYAQQAIAYKCTEYILKPVLKENLMELLHRILELSDQQQRRQQETRRNERAYLARTLIALVQGRFDDTDLTYVCSHMHLSAGVRYIELRMRGVQADEEITDEEKRSSQKKIQDACSEFLKRDAEHCIMDVSGEDYDIGFIYCDALAKEAQLEEHEYLESFLDFLRGIVNLPVVMIVGKKVQDIAEIAKSYASACILRSCQGFREQKEICFYEEDVQVGMKGTVLCKDSLDALLHAIEENDHACIMKTVDLFYQEMQRLGVSEKMMSLNINYLLFYLVHLASEQDSGVNQEEILRLISENTSEKGILRGSKAHFCRFACTYGDYLMQLRGKVSKGVISEVEREIQEHYAENLTLKDLSEKYYINTGISGTAFHRQYWTVLQGLSEWNPDRAGSKASEKDR
jgi:two-component system response regulator YesN